MFVRMNVCVCWGGVIFHLLLRVDDPQYKVENYHVQGVSLHRF